MSQSFAAPDQVCTRCGFVIPPEEAARSKDGICAACSGRSKAAAGGGTQRFPIALAGGALGSLIGAGIWAGIAAVTGQEIGIIALLVGYLAGLGVALGGGGVKGRPLQLAAASLAMGGLILGKYLSFAHFVAQTLAEDGVELGPFDPMILSAFPEYVVGSFDAFDLLWVFLALSTAWSALGDDAKKKKTIE